MKIIRWLLSHTFLILLIVVVIYCYMFWGNLAGEDTPAGKAIAYLSQEFVEVEEFVDAVKAKQAELAGERSPAGQAEVVAQDVAQVDAPVQESVAPVASSNNQQRPVHRPVQQLPVNAGYSNNQVNMRSDPVRVTGSQPQAAPVVTPATQAAPPVAIAGGSERFIPVEVEKQLSNVDKQGRVIDASQASGSVKESWVTARKSFYQRNYDKSIQSYKEVIDNTEDNFDAYGELGNVYFNQGKNQQAAAAYFEAAAILIKKGQVNRARSLMGLLRHLDKPKADELQVLIESAKS